jgi:hypothetical protein
MGWELGGSMRQLKSYQNILIQVGTIMVLGLTVYLLL